MRVFLFLIIIFFSVFSFASSCPSNSTPVTQFVMGGAYSASGKQTIDGHCLLHPDKCSSVLIGPNPSDPATNVYWLCVSTTPVNCSAPYTKTSGEFGINYSCTISCPSSHPTSNSQAKCVDSNGCTQDQNFLSSASSCVNKKIEDITARCIAAGAGGPVTVTVPSDGSSPTCSIGTTGFNGTSTNCQTAPGGTACVVPANGLQPPGSQCGSFNGASICVSSSETSAVGTSSNTVGSSTQSGTPKTIEEQISENGQTTKIVKEVTPQTTSTTSVNDSSPLKEGQAMDSGAGPSPVAPITCANGQSAANIQSCDTSVICPADSYVAYGACIKKPTRTTVVAKDVIVTTTTVTNDADNTVVSQTSSTATSFVPVKNPTAPGTLDTQRSGQCDPTAKNYNECVGLLTSISDTEKQTITDSVESKTDTGLTTWNTEQKNSIQGNSNGLGVSTSVLDTMLNPFKISSQTCTSFTVNFLKTTKTLDCTRFEFFKKLFGWALYLYTIYYIFMLIVKPVER